MEEDAVAVVVTETMDGVEGNDEVRDDIVSGSGSVVDGVRARCSRDVGTAAFASALGVAEMILQDCGRAEVPLYSSNLAHTSYR